MIALSSAEAELYAMVAASAESLANVAYSRDLGITKTAEIYTDSSAALGISQRSGLGKVRHLRTQGLWVQEARQTGRLAYRKVLGSMNPADVLTKHVPAEVLHKHIGALGVEARGGRANTAPELNSLEAVRLRRLDKNEKRVRFAEKVLFKGIPAEGLGKPCRLSTKVRFVERMKDQEQKKTAPIGIHKGQKKTAPLQHKAKSIGRRSWADLADEEELERNQLGDGERK